jgi:hypothetical protein
MMVSRSLVGQWTFTSRAQATSDQDQDQASQACGTTWPKGPYNTSKSHSALDFGMTMKLSLLYFLISWEAMLKLGLFFRTSWLLLRLRARTLNACGYTTVTPHG